MKKAIFTLFSICTLYFGANAQYCGSSGPTVCDTLVIDSPGLSPKPADLARLINGTDINTTIHFKNYNTFSFSGSTITIQKLGIDSIVNLPKGLCWATNQPNNTFGNQQNGCIAVTGHCCSAPGQYRLGIYVAAYIGTPNPLHINSGFVGLYYYVRVNNNNDTTTRAIDTTGQHVSADSTKFRSYNNELSTCGVGIDEVTPSVSELSVVPNPFNNKAVVSFYSDRETTLTERFSNMLGSVVYTRDIQVRMGENSSIIEKNALPSGIYFYTLSNNRSLVTKRVMITE